MPERIIFPEFRDELEFTRYPFADGATLISSTTQHELEEDTFLDASLYPIGGGSQLHISRIIVEPREVTIWFSSRVTPNLCFAQFDPIDAPYNVEVQDNFGRPAGVLVSDPIRLSRFSAWDSGTHVFPVQATELCASCVIPTPELGLRGLATIDGDVLAGDVWLVGANGVVVREDGDCTIRIDIVGDPLFVRQLCVPVDLFSTPNFLRTINGCPGDEFGNFRIEVGTTLAPDTILRVNPIDNGLKIEAIGDLVRIRN